MNSVNSEDLIEGFVSAMMLVVLFIGVLYVWNPDYGRIAIEILPAFLQMTVYILLGLILIFSVYEILEE